MVLTALTVLTAHLALVAHLVLMAPPRWHPANQAPAV
jgi:hypothetical protein